MKDWFDSLETREQIFVAVGGIFLLVALVYALLWMPLDKNHRQAQQSVADWQRSLAELGPLRAMVANAGSRAVPVAPRPRSRAIPAAQSADDD